MRRLLDALYDAAAYAAAFFMVATLVWVLVGIAGRLLHFHVPGTDAYAGYSMAAAGFLALAHTLKRREHIRVTLLLEHTGEGTRRGLELWSLAVATLLAALFAFYSIRLAYQSWDFNDISTATDATPLWIPQIAMATGTLVLFVAFVDELVLAFCAARGAGSGARRDPAQRVAEETPSSPRCSSSRCSRCSAAVSGSASRCPASRGSAWSSSRRVRPATRWPSPSGARRRRGP